MNWKKATLLLFILLMAWITIDLNYPLKTDIRKIDAVEVADLETKMWRSYYEKRPVRLFLQSAELTREMFHVPFWRSYLIAYYSAKAAFVFKDGHDRNDYEKALPYLRNFYQHISDISRVPFNPDKVARDDLEWWILRRYREQHPPGEWEKYISATASGMYHIPVERFRDYSHFAVEAMLLRDATDTSITEENWKEVNRLLLKSWQSFSQDVGN